MLRDDAIVDCGDAGKLPDMQWQTATFSKATALQGKTALRT